jgi:phosphoribosylformimino-5-aminoimidazole carboxamide ribotide isomerase
VQIYPAIDIRRGRVVRVAETDIVFDHEPLAVASRLITEGARWLHVVDLDRAFGTGRDNDAVLRRICALPGVRVQIGGSLSGIDDVTRALDLGGSRAVVATIAAARSGELERMAATLTPESLAVGLDMRDGKLATRGKGALLGGLAGDLLRRATAAGIRVAICRDLNRDGTLGGPDVAAAARLVGLGAKVIVSGGVASVEHLRNLRDAGLDGAIVGRALHEGRLTLTEALACSQ